MIFRRVPGHFLPVCQGVFSKDSINNRTFRFGGRGVPGALCGGKFLKGDFICCVDRKAVKQFYSDSKLKISRFIYT